MNTWQKAFGLLLASLTLMALGPHDATAKSSSERAIKFQLCANNVKNIGLYKQSGLGNLWHFVVTLNDAGTSQFRELEEKHFGEPVEIVWADVTFGRRRLDIVDLSDVHHLMLVSRWQNYREAQERMSLLHDRLLHKRNLGAPCGARVRLGDKKATSL